MYDLQLITSRNDQETVNITTTLISQSKISSEQKRKLIMLRNTSTGGQVITVNFGFTPAIQNKGIVLNPNEVMCDSSSEGYDCWQGTINAISDIADGKLTVFER